ncbi:Peroxidase [Rhynchospora pubera]|uniref:Peroxidase n=1 Tax=Rhynchospora pubera TaxID=906938 RepID=A0AAV8H0E0_9POAL|nr:Peroxidase [Rhynchospora pubera]KAJ4808473.1 Peroxidase [Rhynchospora pubera]
MATLSYIKFLAFLVLSLLACSAHGQLTNNFYQKTCPKLETIVRSVMTQAIAKEARMGASILRLFFHDCFVNGCDAGILLDDTPTFTGEKSAGPNANSARGFDVIDAIKTQVEASCNATVSCADILALATRDGVNLLGGPTWNVPLGRRDARTASLSGANSNLPGPGSSLSTLISMFSAQGLTARDMTVLSGAHTIGQAQCQFFRNRIFNEKNVNASFASLRQQTCPQSGSDSTLAPIDVRSPNSFDNAYYVDLVNKQGLFHSDQELFNGGSQDNLVTQYSTNAALFASDFAKAMVKLGNIKPLTGKNGEIRLNCRKIN